MRTSPFAVGVEESQEGDSLTGAIAVVQGDDSSGDDVFVHLLFGEVDWLACADAAFQFAAPSVEHALLFLCVLVLRVFGEVAPGARVLDGGCVGGNQFVDKALQLPLHTLVAAD